MKTIEELAREAGLLSTPWPGMRAQLIDEAGFTRFAALVRAEALEEAAKVCEQRASDHEEDAGYEEDPDYSERFKVYAKHERHCANDIRALKDAK